MSAVALVQQKSGAALAGMTETELCEVLQSSLYPGASLPSIKLVLGYCKAAGLDPMQKPVHIVPMWDSKAKQMRDTVMPGIGLYRTQAARTGQYAGVSDPTFGPTINGKIGGVDVSYPEWCRISVTRLLENGREAVFPATEYWIENYAQKGGADKSIAPNAMWLKRPFGQIAKCTEAQALRKAFPEIGSQPTAEEMEGKPLDERDITPAKAELTVDPHAAKRAELVKALEAAAAKGGRELQAAFRALTAEERSILTVPEWERIKKLVVPTKTVEPETVVEQKKLPTCAEIMESIKTEASVEILGAIANSLTHLPEDQQSELLVQITKKVSQLSGGEE